MQSSIFDTVIIGAGFAGVSAAIELAQSGKKVALLEARAEPGGRTRTVESGFGVTDNGQHLLMGCYENTFKTLSALRTQKHIWRSATVPLNFYVDGATIEVAPGAAWLPSTLRFGASLMSSSLLTASDKVALTHAFLRLTLCKAPVGLTVEEWLDSIKQPPRLVQTFWEPLCLATINATIQEADAYLLWQVLRLAFLGKEGASDFAFATCSLSELLLPVSKELSNLGSHYASKANVKGVSMENGLFSVHTKQHARYQSQSVIVATPPSTAEKLLAPLVSLPLFECTYSPIASMYVRLSQDAVIPIMTAGVGTTTQWVFNSEAIRSRQHVCTTRELSVTVSAATAATQSREVFMHTVIQELRSMFANLEHTEITDTHLIIEKRATPVLSPSINAQRPSNNTDVPGLFIAGDYTQTELPATIESAAKSGRVAAELVQHHLASQVR